MGTVYASIQILNSFLNSGKPASKPLIWEPELHLRGKRAAANLHQKLSTSGIIQQISH